MLLIVLVCLSFDVLIEGVVNWFVYPSCDLYDECGSVFCAYMFYVLFEVCKCNVFCMF